MQSTCKLLLAPCVRKWHKCEVRDVRSLVPMRGKADVADIGVTASEIYMRQSEPPCSRKSAVPRGIFGSLASSNGAQPIDRAEVQALSETTRLCLLSLVCEPSVPAPRPRLPSRSNTPCSPREPPG